MIIPLLISNLFIDFCPPFILNKSSQKFANFILPLRKPTFGFVSTLQHTFIFHLINITVVFIISIIPFLNLLWSNQDGCLAYLISASYFLI